MKGICILAVSYVALHFAGALPPLQEQVPTDFGGNEEPLLGGIRPLASGAKLPATMSPSWCKLEIRPIIEETGSGERFTAPGKLWCTGPAIGATNFISLNARNIAINNNSIWVRNDFTNQEIPVTNAFSEDANEFYTIQFAQAMNIGRNYSIYMEFVSQVNTELNLGLYASTYWDYDGSPKYIASTDFQAPDARMAFPCFDEPAYKTVWEFEIIRMEQHHSLANMNLLRSEPVPELPGWVRDVFAPTVKMSTYLLCFAISDYTVEHADPSLYSKPVQVWGPPPLMARGNGNFSPDFSAKLMDFFERYYRIEYSLPKMDKISIPDYSAGAMENWGLNTYRDTRLLYEAGISTAQDMFSMTNTISHELVHQWWGNLITCAWWDDLWIQEGAATYYAPVGVQGVGHTDLLPMETLITASVQRSLDFDANLALTHPIHNEGVDPANVPVLFDTLTYHKGASLIRMMNAFMTTSLYDVAMTRFLNRYSYSNANQFQMFAELDQVASETAGHALPVGVNVTDIMTGWTLQPGFPVISVERNDLTRNVTLTQTRFFQRPNQNEEDTTKWFVPISIFRQGDSVPSSRPERWIRNDQSSISIVPLSSTWFIVNPQTHGYYRVKYSRSLLDAIINQLHLNHTVFDEQIRSSLIDDNLNLAYAQYIDMSTALNLTLYLKNERSLFPWQSFFTNMAMPYRIFGRSVGFREFKSYVLSLSADALNEINIDPQPADPNPTILLRTRLVEWSCNLGDATCIAYAKQKFANWMANPNNVSAVFPDLQPSVYCTAIAHGSDAEWDFVFEQYKQADRDVMQVNLLRALACSRTSFRLNSLLEMAITPNSGILNKHRATVMQAVAGNSMGYDITLAFLKQHKETIIRRFGTGLISSAITTLSTQVNNPIESQELMLFAMAVPISITPALQENINKNMHWVTYIAPDFLAFIRQL